MWAINGHPWVVWCIMYDVAFTRHLLDIYGNFKDLRRAGLKNTVCPVASFDSLASSTTTRVRPCLASAPQGSSDWSCLKHFTIPGCEDFLLAQSARKTWLEKQKGSRQWVCQGHFRQRKVYPLHFCQPLIIACFDSSPATGQVSAQPQGWS